MTPHGPMGKREGLRRARQHRPPLGARAADAPDRHRRAAGRDAAWMGNTALRRPSQRMSAFEIS